VSGDCQEPICDLGGTVVSVGDNTDSLSQDIAGDCRGTQCQNGELVANDNDKEEDFCCYSGEKLKQNQEQERGFGADYDGPLVTKCLDRFQNNRKHEVDGCSVPDLDISITLPPSAFGPSFSFTAHVPISERNDPIQYVARLPGISSFFPYGLLNQLSTAFGRDLMSDYPDGIPSSSFAGPEACNQHDICYQTCAVQSGQLDPRYWKLACDDALKWRADLTCDAAYPPCPYPSLDVCNNYDRQRTVCHAFATIYQQVLKDHQFVGVWPDYELLAFWQHGKGYDAFRQRQEQYCNCCGP
jgi:hypothetical protein